jgi:hypothetical protein
MSEGFKDDCPCCGSSIEYNLPDWCQWWYNPFSLDNDRWRLERVKKEVRRFAREKIDELSW